MPAKPVVQVLSRMPPELHAAVVAAAAKAGLSVNAWMIKAATAALARK